MNYFGYVERQKQLIRDRHAGKDIFSARGAGMVRQGEGTAPAAADSVNLPDEKKTVEQLLRELASLKGLTAEYQEPSGIRRTAEDCSVCGK